MDNEQKTYNALTAVKPTSVLNFWALLSLVLFITLICTTLVLWNAYTSPMKLTDLCDEVVTTHNVYTDKEDKVCEITLESE